MAAPRIHPARTLKARIAALGVEAEAYPENRSAASLTVDFEGLPGTRHHGFLRKAGAREPWYPRGSLMRSGRQIAVVGVEELAEIAAAMNLPRIDPDWIGSNVVVEGLPALSWLPAGTRLATTSGAVLVVEGQNAPCRIAGKAIARHLPDEDRAGVDLAFAKEAKGRRGLVASVERAGTIAVGDVLTVKIGPQWIYDPDDGAQGELL